MQINGGQSHLIARAYGVKGPSPAVVGKVTAAVPATRPAPVDESASAARGAGPAKLVAAVVPGKVDFSGDVPQPGGQALGPGGTYQMYRRPTDRVEAATAVSLGRSLDIRG